jgi:hypothetical protein
MTTVWCLWVCSRRAAAAHPAVRPRARAGIEEQVDPVVSQLMHRMSRTVQCFATGRHHHTPERTVPERAESEDIFYVVCSSSAQWRQDARWPYRLTRRKSRPAGITSPRPRLSMAVLQHRCLR